MIRKAEGIGAFSGEQRNMNIPETDQNRIDVSNLRFYARLFRENHWETDVMHWSVFSTTLDKVADRIAKAEQTVAELTGALKNALLVADFGQREYQEDEPVWPLEQHQKAYEVYKRTRKESE